MTDSVISKTVLAELAGVSARRLDQLIRDGDGPAQVEGSTVPVAAAAAWLRKRWAPPSNAKVRLEAARARLAELRVFEREKTLLPSNEVLALWQDTIAAARARLLAMPRKVAGRVAALRSLPEIEALLQDEIYAALTELSRTDGVPLP